MKEKNIKPKKRNSFTPLQINQSIQKKNSTVWESKGASAPFVGTFATLLSQTVHSPRSKKYSKRKFVTGFTLVELLMVTVVIAILATILYPQFETFRIRAGLKEVPNTVQVILAAERYYNYKKGGYFPWDWTEAISDYVNAEDELNIEIPPTSSDTTICQYRVLYDGTTSQYQILFRSNDGLVAQNQGHYVIEDTVTPANTDTYVIDSYNGKWEKYLKYLEP